MKYTHKFLAISKCWLPFIYYKFFSFLLYESSEFSQHLCTNVLDSLVLRFQGDCFLDPVSN